MLVSLRRYKILVMSNSEFEKMIGWTNPVESFGIDPSIIKQVNGTGGAEALRILYKGVYRAIASATHPDITNADVPEIFRDVTESMDRVAKLSDSDLVDLSLAKANKKRGNAKKEIVEVEAPEITEMVTQLSESIIEGKITNELLKSPFIVELKEADINRVLQYTPDDKLIVVGETESVDAQIISEQLSDDQYGIISTGSFWDAVTPIMSSNRLTRHEGEKSLTEHKSVVIDGTKNGETRVVSLQDGKVIEMLDFISTFSGFTAHVSKSRSISNNTEDQNNAHIPSDNLFFSDVCTFRSYDKPQESDISVLGVLRPEYKEYIDAYITEKKVTSDNFQFAGTISSPTKRDAGSQDQRVTKFMQFQYKLNLMSHHLDTIQRKRLVEYYDTSIKQNSILFGKDKNTGELKVLGTVKNFFF